jgi:hypothetical protein
MASGKSGFPAHRKLYRALAKLNYRPSDVKTDEGLWQIIQRQLRFGESASEVIA